jgi:signal transduction histidine kinase
MKLSGTSNRIAPFLSRLAGAFPGGVAYLDRRLVFTFCNDVQAGYFGRAPEAIIGRRLHDVAPDNPHFWEEIERVVSTGERSPQTALSVTWTDRPEEGEHHYLVSYKADLTPTGSVRGVFITTFEVTRAMLHERDDDSRLRERIKTLELMVTEREMLVGIISHELRTPLTTIFGNAHMLLRRLEDMDEDSRSRVINDIREEAERMNRLVENMLLLARAGAQAAVPTEPLPLAHLLSNVVAEHQKRFDHRSAFVSVKPKSLQGNGQPDYVKQVIQNLLGNAEKYSPDDKPIDVQARRAGDEIIISVLDRGPGVLPAESEIVFQAFYRSDRTSTTVSGAGIGLAVCKLLVQAQSGRIWVRPRRGGGSVFSFTLPAAT